MLANACAILVFIVMLCEAARIRRQIRYNLATLRPGEYVITAERVDVHLTAFSSQIVGGLFNGRHVNVVEVIEVQANHIVWGRIEQPFDGYIPLLDRELDTEYAKPANSAPDKPFCELRRQYISFCRKSADEMKWTVLGDKLRGEKPVGIARLKFKKNESKKVCYLQYAFGYATEAEAQEKAMECCEQSRKEKGSEKNPTRDCKLVGSSVSDGFEKSCNFRLGKKTWMKSMCYCPAERPHVLKPGPSITWHTPGETELYIGVEEQVVCIDECTARSLGTSQTQAKSDLMKDNWPVVFLAVYKLGYGIVHSNLAFCPDTSIVQNRHKCLQPGAAKANCSTSYHTSEFAKSNDVPRLLMDHGCRELIFDGNYGGGLWTPHERETGCWAQGEDSQDFWWDNGGDNGNFRSGIGYQTLFWLTSDNTRRPFAEQKSSFEYGQLDQTITSEELSESGKQSLEMRMKKCFSAKLGNRIDFNPGTYSLLHHNCNKFSSEAMRELDLPRFYSDADKGTHGSISLSATPEESRVRRGLHKIISYFQRHRSSVSKTCQSEFFQEAELNCRRIGWGGRKGDCPTDLYETTGLRCYDPNKRSSQATGGLSTPVAYNERVNGVCGIPAESPCDKEGSDSLAPCQPGFHCADVEFIVKDGNISITKVKSVCAQDVDCSSAVAGATMRERDNLVMDSWCKCPSGMKPRCGSHVFDRYFNPSSMQSKGSCSCEKM